MGKINGAKKGKQFERDVANALGHIFPNAERMLEYQASGVVGIDLQNTGEFDIQCKRNAGYAPIGKIKEIQVRDPNRTPVLITKGNNMPAMAVIPFDRFIKLLERIPDIHQKDEIMTSISNEVLEAVPTLEHQDYIETTATPSKVAPVTFTNIGSKPAKGEETLTHTRAMELLTNITGYPVVAREDIKEHHVLVSATHKNGNTLEAFFELEWMREAGAIRLMAAIDNWIRNNNNNITVDCLYVYLKEKVNTLDIIPEEPKPVTQETVNTNAGYSFI